VSGPRARRIPTLRVPHERFELRCGAKLLVSPRPGAPVTAVQVHLRGGPSLDAPGREGTSFLTGALADQGTENLSEEEILGALESAGGHLGGDATGLTGNVAGDRWKLLCELLAEVLTRPVYPADKVRRQKARILDRLLVERDDPRVQAERRFRRLVYGDHWLGRPAYGNLESIPLVQPRNLRSFHRKNWVGARAVIGLCGDVDPKAVRRHLDRLLAHWEPGADLPVQPAEFPRRDTRVDAFQAPRQQVHLYLGHLGIRRKDPDYPALMVMDHVLGTGPGFTNRISKRLRDELGLAYAVHANIHGSAGILPGLFTAYIGTSPEHVPTAMAGFLAEISRIQEEPVRARELDIAKDYLVGSFALAFQRASRRAGYLIAAERHELPEDNLQRLPRQLAAITAEDVQAAARRHLHPRSCCVSASGPIKKGELSRVVAELRRGGLPRP